MDNSYLLDTSPPQNANKICFCTRLIRIFDFVLNTPARPNASRLAFALAYSYLCRVLAGLFYILFCWALGNGVSLLVGGYLPGSIIGMILLFASLCLHIVDAEMIRPAARFLLGAMALFFIPYGVGLIVSYEVLLDNFWAIVISGGVSTMLVLVCVGRVFQKLNKKV